MVWILYRLLVVSTGQSVLHEVNSWSCCAKLRQRRVMADLWGIVHRTPCASESVPSPAGDMERERKRRKWRRVESLGRWRRWVLSWLWHECYVPNVAKIRSWVLWEPESARRSGIESSIWDANVLLPHGALRMYPILRAMTQTTEATPWPRGSSRCSARDRLGRAFQTRLYIRLLSATDSQGFLELCLAAQAPRTKCQAKWGS